MTTDTKAPLQSVEEKPKRHRSPNYPAVGLSEAVERTAAYMKLNTMAATLPESAAKAIGFSSAHGSAMSVLAALKKFGLMEDKDGRVSPTKRAAEIINLPKDDLRRLNAIREAAMTPPLYRELLELYKDTGIPADEALIGELTTYKGFSVNAAKEFLKAFRETLEFSGLSGVQVLEFGSGEKEQEKPEIKVKIGDFVQWESNGMLRFPEAKKLIRVDEKSGYAFVDGYHSGMPLSELIPAEPPVRLNYTPPSPKSLRVGGEQGAAMKQDVFSIAEGEVVISWPTPLSQESIADLKDWLKIVERKITRQGVRQSKMQEEVRDGSCIDVSAIGTKVKDGLYRLNSFDREADIRYCDTESADWIRSIGKHKQTGEIFASTTGEFFGNPDYDCLWLV